MIHRLFFEYLFDDACRSIEISNLPALEFMLKKGEKRIPHHPRIKPRAKPNRPGPGGPYRIFDFEMRKEPLIITELRVK